MKKNFEEFLQEKFMDLREIGGRAITKDNCEDMFSAWLENRDIAEIIDYGDEYGNYKYMQAMEKCFPKVDKIVSLVKEYFDTEMESNRGARLVYQMLGEQKEKLIKSIQEI